jgi:hypothetical protein
MGAVMADPGEPIEMVKASPVHASSAPFFGSVDELLREIFTQFFAGQEVYVYTTFSENMQTPAIIARRDRKSGTLALQTKDDRRPGRRRDGRGTDRDVPVCPAPGAAAAGLGPRLRIHRRL